MTKCINCVAGQHKLFCLSDGNCNDETPDAEISILDVEEKPKELKDPISTGRKRAAVLYPIPVGMICEWAWMKNCGGGPIRITGCTGRPATDIHHGINKSTLANERENISILCNYCHNRFHVANDKFYKEPRPKDNSDWLPDEELIKKYGGGPMGRLDEMVRATKQEILLHEMTIPEGGKDRVKT